MHWGFQYSLGRLYAPTDDLLPAIFSNGRSTLGCTFPNLLTYTSAERQLAV